MGTTWRRQIERSRPEYRRSLLRASLLLGALLLPEILLLHQLVWRDLSKRQILATLDNYHKDLQQVAERLSDMLEQEGQYDLFTIKEKVTYVTQQLSSTMAQRVGFHHVSVYDSEGRMIVTIYRMKSDPITLPAATTSAPRFAGSREIPESAEDPATGKTGEAEISTEVEPPLDSPPDGIPLRSYRLDSAENESLLVVPVAADQGPSGEVGVVKLGYDERLLEEEAAQVQRDLMKKVIAWVFLTLVVLSVGFLYVLKLLQKTRRLEAEAQIADRLAYIGTLASGLAHEIRNPLNAMNMNLQMLEEELAACAQAGVGPADAQDTRALMEGTKGEIRRLDRLVNSFLAFARPAALNLEPSDLNRTLEEVVRFLRADLSSQGIEVFMRTAEPMPPVDLDEAQFRQAIMNILINARQVLPSGGRIEISTSLDPAGEPVVRIEDNGPGIPADQLPKVFEVFYSTRSGGTGLGLPIAQRIIEGHGGRIELESALGRGTVFTITLRRARRSQHAAVAAGEPVRSGS